MRLVVPRKYRERIVLGIAWDLPRAGDFVSMPKVLVFAHNPLNFMIEIYTELRDESTFIQIPADHPDFKKLTEKVDPEKIIPSIGVTVEGIRHPPFTAHSIYILDRLYILSSRYPARKACRATGPATTPLCAVLPVRPGQPGTFPG